MAARGAGVLAPPGERGTGTVPGSAAGSAAGGTVVAPPAPILPPELLPPDPDGFDGAARATTGRRARSALGA